MQTELRYHLRVPLLLLAVPVLSTLAGGALAIRFRTYVTALTAVGAGLLLGAAFLDILPEAIWMGMRSGLTISGVLGLTLLSFLLFHSIESVLRTLAARAKSETWDRGIFRRAGAAMLIFHSFRDGMAIGAAYSASHAAGIAVATGIAAHDLGDGMNTVILTTRGKQATLTDYLFLVADALAPLLGGLLTSWWVLSAKSSVYVLVLAAGFFLEMATGDFLPDLRRHIGSRRYLAPCVLGGVAIIYLANLLLARFSR